MGHLLIHSAGNEGDHLGTFKGIQFCILQLEERGILEKNLLGVGLSNRTEIVGKEIQRWSFRRLRTRVMQS